MGFWHYCEKVALGVGVQKVIQNIQLVRRFWEENKTVGEAWETLNAQHKVGCFL